MRILATLFVAALSLLAGTERARACSCAAIDPPAALARADAVFEGRVLSVDADPAGTVRATMEIVQSWRGIEVERVVVETAASSAACGVAFEADTSWLVYAQRQGEIWSTGICARTRRIEDAGEDLAELGAGVVPVEVGAEDDVEEPASRAPARGGCASCGAVGSARPGMGALGPLALTAFALTAFALSALVGWRARRARRAKGASGPPSPRAQL